MRSFRTRNRKLLAYLIVSLFAYIASQLGLIHKPLQSINSTDTSVIVSKVIDGDTIILSTGEHVRYIGVNAPETKTHACYAKEASLRNIELVEGKNVILKKDVSDTDKYDRLLRYIYLPDGTFVNKTLVLEGFARAKSYPPDISHQKELQEAQQLSETQQKGLWKYCENPI